SRRGQVDGWMESLDAVGPDLTGIEIAAFPPQLSRLRSRFAGSIYALIQSGSTQPAPEGPAVLQRTDRALQNSDRPRELWRRLPGAVSARRSPPAAAFTSPVPTTRPRSPARLTRSRHHDYRRLGLRRIDP